MLKRLSSTNYLSQMINFLKRSQQTVCWMLAWKGCWVHQETAGDEVPYRKQCGSDLLPVSDVALYAQ